MLGHGHGEPDVSGPGAAATDMMRRSREVRVLRPVVMWLRVGAIALAWVIIGVGQRPVEPVWLLAGTAVLVAYTTWRLLAGAQSVAELRSGVVVEPVIAIAAVLITGGWASPFVLYLAIPILNVAVAVGPRAVGAAAAMAAMMAAHEALDATAVTPTEVTQALVPMAVAIGVGLVSWRLVSQAEDEHSRTLGRMQQLAHVNALLSTLHDLVRSTPAPLTVEDVLQVIRGELDELFDADEVLLLLADQGGRWWRPVTVEGTAVGWLIPLADLPAELLAHQSSRPVEIDRFAPGSGITPEARSGAYLWLFSRGQPAALLALEHHEPRALPQARLDVLERMSAPLGLAIDNAVWFQRLRTLGAEEERQRIGATLHDRFAQSLAYVNMELDRISTTHPDDGALMRLRGDVRTTLADLRETLRELRMRCTEDRGLIETLGDLLARFGDRYGMIVDFDADEGLARPPLSVENQLLRIAQDLLQLAQREAGATSVGVSLKAEPGRLRLVVRDDGRGTVEEQLGHEASTIISLVRERADAIGGLVDVITRPGEGTEVAVTVRGLL